MKRTSVCTILFGLTMVITAFEIPVTQIRKRTSSSANEFNRFYSASTAGSASASTITNAQNILYTAEVTIGGRSIPVQLDTGSSDLWILGSQCPGCLSTAQNISNLSLNLTYGIGSVLGGVSITDIEFADISVHNQALLGAAKALDEDVLFKRGVYGIIGLGFDTLSHIYNKLQATFKDDRGRSVLSNIFAQNASEPNHIAFHLDRIGDLDEESRGSFSIGTFDPKYIAVKDSPALPVFNVKAKSGARWSTALDAIEINGHNLTFPKSAVSASPTGKLIALLDTGATFIYTSHEIVTAFYSSIEGAVYYETGGLWFIPCLAEPKAAFWFSGKRYPMHPLDLTQPMTNQVHAFPNRTFCVGEIRAFPSKVGNGEFDVQLGDIFLRNVYSVYDFGDTDPKTRQNGNPYMKLLSVTDEVEASADYKVSRAKSLAALPPLGDLTALLEAERGTTPSGTANAPVSNLAGVANDSTSNAAIAQSVDRLLSLTPATLGLLSLNALALLALVGLGVVFLRKGKKNGGISAPRYQPVRLPPKMGDGGSGYDEPQYDEHRYDA